jgi:peptidoglycan/xylan/chitin deacetylase (PgdA/CDA1 family)
MRTCFIVAIAAAFGACTDESSLLQYGWDDKQVLCSTNIDDLTRDPAWDLIESALDVARDRRSVAILHTHVPDVTVSMTALDRVFSLAEQRQLDFVTFADLKSGAPSRAGLALSFDDAAIDAWYGIRDVLDARSVRVTFFVTRYYNWTPEQRSELMELAARGHDVQAHSVDHLDAPVYVSEHGLAAYLTDEALPSIDQLEADGFPVSAYAFPFGASTDELDDALLEHVAFVRVGLGSCPHD